MLLPSRPTPRCTREGRRGGLGFPRQSQQAGRHAVLFWRFACRARKRTHLSISHLTLSRTHTRARIFFSPNFFFRWCNFFFFFFKKLLLVCLTLRITRSLDPSFCVFQEVYYTCIVAREIQIVRVCSPSLGSLLFWFSGCSKRSFHSQLCESKPRLPPVVSGLFNYTRDCSSVSSSIM